MASRSVLTMSLRILGWILLLRSALERLKRQAVAAIWIWKTEGYSRAHDKTSVIMSILGDEFSMRASKFPVVILNRK